MKSAMRHATALWFMTVLALWGPVAHGGGAEELDAAGIRTVIEAQLAAFAADDGAKAFALATPGIQRMFGTPEGFVDMVKTAYPVVYRPASVRFLSLEYLGGEPVQAVQMSDAEGRVWLAVYRMQKQADGSWRIDGCALRLSAGKSV
jgi:hypothetical protein